MILDRNFWARAGERLVKTWLYSFAAVLLIALGNPTALDQGNALTPENVLALPWVAAFITATMTTALSAVTAVITANFINHGGPVPLYIGVGERAVKTFLQTFVATLGYVSQTVIGVEGFLNLPWATAASTAAVATLLSIIASLQNADFTKGVLEVEVPSPKPNVAIVAENVETLAVDTQTNSETNSPTQLEELRKELG